MGILMSILFPALGKARREAQKVLCISNLKQILVATYIYDGNYNSFPTSQGKAHKLIQLNVVGVYVCCVVCVLSGNKDLYDVLAGDTDKPVVYCGI